MKYRGPVRTFEEEPSGTPEAKSSFLKKPLYLAISLAAIIAVIVSVVIIVNSKNEGLNNSEFAAASEEEGRKEREKYPILAYLPVKNALFTLGYQLIDDNLVVKITTSESYLDDAVEKLKSFGEDLSGLNLEFLDPSGKSLENPFLSAYVMNGEVNPSNALIKAYAKVENFKVIHVEYANDQNEVIDLAQPDNFSAVKTVLAKITAGSAAEYNLETYRVVLKRDEQNRWYPVANPSPLLTVFNTSNVTETLLNAANKL